MPNGLRGCAAGSGFFPLRSKPIGVMIPRMPCQVEFSLIFRGLAGMTRITLPFAPHCAAVARVRLWISNPGLSEEISRIERCLWGFSMLCGRAAAARPKRSVPSYGLFPRGNIRNRFLLAITTRYGFSHSCAPHPYKR